MKKAIIVAAVLAIAIVGIVILTAPGQATHPQAFYSQANRVIIQKAAEEYTDRDKYIELRDEKWIKAFLEVIDVTGKIDDRCACMGEARFSLFTDNDKIGMICLWNDKIRCYGMESKGDLKISEKTYQEINRMLSELKDWKTNE